MFELFPDQPVYEYPQLINVTYSFLWAFLLSSIVAITHKFTFTGDYYPKNFFQALVLGSIITTLVMLAIGDSLARGLGVFGAMAIIRFRTRIEDPRDVLFLFASLSVGLAIGVFGYTISFVGTLLFCMVAVLLHYTNFRSYSHHSSLYFTLSNAEKLEQVNTIVKSFCADYRVVSILVNKENALRYQYSVSLKSNTSMDALMQALGSIEGIRQVKISSNEIEQQR